MKKIRKNRRNLRKVKIILILITLILLSGVGVYLNFPRSNTTTSKETEQIRTSEDIIDSILQYQLDEGIDKQFLTWINENYEKGTLEKMEISLIEGTYNNTIWYSLTNNSLLVLKDKYNNISLDRTKTINSKKEEILLSFIGDVSLADDWYIMPKYDERGKGIYGILSEDIVNIMTSSDIMVANNEFTISNRGEKMPNKYYTFRGAPKRLSIYKEMGVNLVTLANNHIYDYVETAFYDALDSLEEYDIPYIGAGRNLNEAMQPFYYIVGGYKIGFVNATRAEKFILTPEATDTTGGVLRCYNPSRFISVIEETKKNSDFVIALVHWGKEDSSNLEDVQVETSKMYIDAGADLIVGTHAHTLQGIDFYNDKAIIYNIGDFIFNHETKDTGIFQLKIDDTGSFKYYFIPCKQKDKYTYLLNDSEKIRVLDKMRGLSPNVSITNEGEILNNTN